MNVEGGLYTVLINFMSTAIAIVGTWLFLWAADLVILRRTRQAGEQPQIAHQLAMLLFTGIGVVCGLAK